MYIPSKNTLRLRALVAKKEAYIASGDEMRARQVESDITRLCDKMDAA